MSIDKDTAKKIKGLLTQLLSLLDDDSDEAPGAPKLRPNEDLDRKMGIRSGAPAAVHTEATMQLGVSSPRIR